MNKQYRIKKSSEIESIIKKRKSVGNKYFVVYKMSNQSNKHFRIAFSVGKKYGNAVMRNQMKRRLRSIIHESIESLDNQDIFVVAKPLANELCFDDIKREINHLLRKNKLLRS